MEDNKRNDERLLDPIESEFGKVINNVSGENESNTPDYMLGEFLTSVYHAANKLIRDRENWYGVHCEPGNIKVDTKCEGKEDAIEKLKNAKQYILITVNGSNDPGMIDWDTKSLADAFTLVERGFKFIHKEYLKRVLGF